MFASGMVAMLATQVGTSAAVAKQKTTATPIQHVVDIFQENVSFDHYFGTYPTATNTDGTTFTAKATTPSVNGLSPTLLTANPNGSNPARLANTTASASGLQSVLTCDQDHNYTDEQTAFDGGAMDKFVSSVGTGSGKNEVTGATCQAPQVMDYYDGNTVTAMWNYAQEFAMSDASFSSTFGPSAPGAVNLVSGDTGGVDTTGCTTPNSKAGCAHMAGSVSFATPTSPNADLTADGLGGYSLTSDAQPFYDDCSTRDAVALTGTNIGDELSANGISWGWFQGGFDPSTPYATAEAAQASPHGTSTFVPDEFSGKYNATVPVATALGGGTTSLNQGICNSFHDIGANLPAPNTGTGQFGAKGDYIAHHEPFQYYATTANPHHLTINDAVTKPGTPGNETLGNVGTDTQNFSGSLYGFGTPQFNTANHQYDMSDFDALVAAIHAGKLPASSLPAVSFLKAPGYEDGHAQYSDPIDEQHFVTNEINALMKTPAWKSTVVFINYDDSDGWYDHAYASASTDGKLVPINPSQSPADNLFNTLSRPYTAGVSQTCFNASDGQPIASTALASQMGRCGLGPRQPMIAISCYSKTNYVDNATSDLSSVDKFIQGNWGLPAISGSFANSAHNQVASKSRYDAEGPLANLLNFSQNSQDDSPCSPYLLNPATGAVMKHT